ncbi:MAG: hydrogen gas-evolving membrane-bound hydrogenase subunit E [Actinomycetota bacterium]
MTMLGLLGLHLAVFAPLSLLGRRLGTKALLVAAVAPAASFAWLITRAPAVLGGETVRQSVGWVAGLDLALTTRLDAFGLIMATLITGIGVLVFVYSYFYFDNGPEVGRFAAILLAFGGSMLGVVITDSLLALFIFWELTSVTSYLLIGFKDSHATARASAMQALLVTGLGGLAMLAGFVLVGSSAGTYSMSEIFEAPPTGPLVTSGLLLVLLGAFTKSAQVPFHFWLPGAMAAPTPVSAYLHSATMVKAGVYLIARFAPAFAPMFSFFTPLVVGVGVATMLIGGYRALKQHDLKLLLAYGTVSQLGFVVALVGSGHPGLTFAGVGMILAHALFKATLFLVVGIIDHQTHTRDIRELSGLGRRMPVLFGVAAAATWSMVGLPPTVGYLTKEAALEHLLAGSAPWAISAIALATVLTVAYSARFLWGAFATKPATGEQMVGAHAPKASAGILLAPAILAAMTVLMGLWTAPAEKLAVTGARALDSAVGSPRLYLWHGFTPAVGIAALALAAGLALFAFREAAQRFQRRWQFPLDAANAYHAWVKGLNIFAVRLTGVLQNGSLPTYIAVILITVLGVPTWSLLRYGDLPTDLRISESPLQLVVVLGLTVAAVTCTALNRRFAAVLMLGAVGFFVAILFVIQGAPDLALAQLLIETLSLIMFVLVLRHLPEHFAPFPWRFGWLLRMGLAATVGTVVFGFALIAGNARLRSPISDEHIARALPDGGGRNVVNVILTDFRAFDTLGEITVLVIAALGVASLVTIRRASNKGDE